MFDVETECQISDPGGTKTLNFLCPFPTMVQINKPMFDTKIFLNFRKTEMSSIFSTFLFHYSCGESASFSCLTSVLGKKTKNFMKTMADCPSTESERDVSLM